MKNFKRGLCAILASLLVFGLTGCKEKEPKDKYIAEYDGIKMETGIYVVQMMGAYMDAASKVSDPTKDFMKEEIDGITAKEWIINKTKADMAENFAIASEFKNKGLELNEEEINYANMVTEQQWMYLGQSYAQSGVTKDDLAAMNILNLKASALFENLYGKGGSKEVPADEIQKAYDENYLKVDYLPVYKLSADGSPLEGDAVKEKEALAKKYLARIKAGEDMETLTKEYSDILDKEAEELQKAYEEAQKAEEEKATAEKNEAAKDLPAVELPSETEENKEDKEKASDEKPADVLNEEDVEKEEAQDTEEAEKEQEPEAPKKLTSLFNKNKNSIFDPEFVKELDDAKNGQILFYESEEYFLIAVKKDINEDEKNLDSAFIEIALSLRSADFEAYIKDVASEINPKYDSILTAKHSPVFLNYNGSAKEEEAENAPSEKATEETTGEAEETSAEEKAETEETK